VPLFVSTPLDPIHQLVRQLARAGFRDQMVASVLGGRFAGSRSNNGLFINSCFAHCQSELPATWSWSHAAGASPAIQSRVINQPNRCIAAIHILVLRKQIMNAGDCQVSGRLVLRSSSSQGDRLPLPLRRNMPQHHMITDRQAHVVVPCGFVPHTSAVSAAACITLVGH
jgi:hypothetical protein